jgi:hypothetical protein
VTAAATVRASQFNPVPPLYLRVHHPANEWIFLSVMSVLAAIGIIVAIVLARRNRTWTPIMCMIGGFLTLYQEPMIDQHLQVWWIRGSLPDVFQAYGRFIPVFLIPALLVYYGVGVMLRWYFLRRFGSRFPIWHIFAIEILLAFAIEPVAINLGLWTYYGFQGVRLFHYPLWWPIVGGTCGVVAGTVIYRLEPYLKGWRVLCVPVVLPLAVMATYWGVGWPMFNLLNLEADHGLVYLGTVVTTLQAVFVVWVCSIATGYHEYRRQRRQGGKVPAPRPEARAEQPAGVPA